MRGLEPLLGVRVVAEPAALDGARWTAAAEGTSPLVLRTAPDEALAIGAIDVTVDDPSAIVEREASFWGRWLTDAELERSVLPAVEWELPEARPALAQGFVATVPAKLWLEDGRSLLVVSRSLVHELEERLR